jgi:hypothetical protein
LNKQDILRYITIFIIIAFVGEIFLLGFRSGGEATPTPTPAAVSRTFTGTGGAPIRIARLTSQFLAECNTTDETVLDKVKGTGGVESATYETSGIVFSTIPALENDTAIVTAAVASRLEDSCEGFALYRFAYVLPRGSVELTGTQKTGNVTVKNATATATNYSLLSSAQLLSSPGVQALIDYRTTDNSTAVAQFSVEMLNGIIRKSSAKEIISTPQAEFSGSGMIMGRVEQMVPRLLARCTPAENQTPANVSAALSSLNLTFFEDSVTTDLYVVSYNQSVTTANKTAEAIKAALSCKAPVQVFQLGLVLPQNGSTCEKIVTYVYADRTEFQGEGPYAGGCRNLSFRKLNTYALAQGAEGVITALDVSSVVNKTVQARVTASTQNGFVTSAIAQEG